MNKKNFIDLSRKDVISSDNPDLYNEILDLLDELLPLDINIPDKHSVFDLYSEMCSYARKHKNGNSFCMGKKDFTIVMIKYFNLKNINETSKKEELKTNSFSLEDFF